MGKKQNNVIDIKLATEKQKIRIDGDDNRIIELDTSDLSVLERLQKVYPRLNELGMKGFDIDDTDEETTLETMEKVSTALSSIDKEMRNIIDYIFDSPIADVCVPTGALYNMYNGQFQFERILDVLFGLYAENIQSEFGKMSARMKQHTAKYTGK